MLQIVLVTCLLLAVNVQGGDPVCDEDCENEVKGTFLDIEDPLRQKDPMKLPMDIPGCDYCNFTGFAKLSLAGRACYVIDDTCKTQTMDIGLDDNPQLVCQCKLPSGVGVADTVLKLLWLKGRIVLSMKDAGEAIMSDKCEIGCESPPCSIKEEDVNMECQPDVQDPCEKLKPTLTDALKTTLEQSWPGLVVGAFNDNKVLAKRVFCTPDE